MKQYKNIAVLFLFVIMLCAACRKDTAEANVFDKLSIDSLKTITTAVIPDAIYTDVFFTNETTGFAISNEGMIIKTTDGGGHWTELVSPADFFLEEIQFTDPQSGFIVGGDTSGSWLLKTINGGNDWTKKNLNSPTGGSPTGLFFLNQHTGFITGPEFFLKTTNGGSNWIPVLPGNTDDFYDVKFNTPHTGVATTTHGVYYTTTDGGDNWQRQETGATDPLGEIYFAGTTTYIRSGNKLINISGKAAIDIPAAVHQLYFLNNHASVGIGQHYESGFWPYGDIFITNNNWSTSSSKKFMPDEALNFSAIARMSDRKIIMLGTGHLKVSVVTLEY